MPKQIVTHQYRIILSDADTVVESPWQSKPITPNEAAQFARHHGYDTYQILHSVYTRTGYTIGEGE